MLRSLVCLALLGAPTLGCSSSGSPAPPATMGGSSGHGGSATSGGGGALSIGGSSAGATGGSATGGNATGGSATGGDSGLGGASGAGLGGNPATSGGGLPSGNAGVPGSTGGAPGGVIVVSDNFDSTAANGPPDPAKWFPPASGSTNGPTVVSAKFHSSPNSASSTGTTSGQGAALIPISGLPTADNHFYVRVWVNFAKATNTVMGHAAFLVAASSRDQSGTELRLGVSIPSGFGTAMVDLNLQNPKDGPGEVTRFSNGFTTGDNPLNIDGTTFAADTWTCVEALFDGGHNEFRLWVNSTEVPTMRVTNFAARPTDPPRVTWAPSFSFLKIGAQNYSGDIGQVWYDDVVVGSAPIGCN